MHKMIVGSIVVVLASTCWVVAQNASSKQVQPPNRPTVGMLPSEKAEALTVAPTTALDSPSAEPVIAVPSRPEFLPNVPPAKPEMNPSPISIPPVPPLPAAATKSTTNIPVKSALPGLPPLPPVPGVSAPPLPGGDMRSRYDGIVVLEPLKKPGDPVWNANQTTQGQLPPPKNEPSTPMHVDPPNYWTERQRLSEIYRNPGEGARTLGPRIWGGADYLMWFTKGQSSPALIQAVTGAGTGATTFDQSQVTTLFPYSNIDYGILSGVRGTIGFWLTPMQTIGVEASYAWLGHNEMSEGYQSTDYAILGRPFVDAATGRNTLYQVSSPGVIDGLIAVSSALHLEGGEANLLFNSRFFGPQLNLLAGLRYFDMSEKLTISQFSDGSNFSIGSFDQFYTRNQFWGGQLGLRWGYEGSRLIANVTGKIGVGAMNERVRIDGSTTVSTATASASASGGVLALPSNIGTYQRTQTAFIPEAVVNLGYKFAPWGTVTVGYNFLYASEVLRPGGQIDNVVNTSNLPGVGGSSGRPMFLFKSEDFWVQGVNIGLTLRY